MSSLLKRVIDAQAETTALNEYFDRVGREINQIRNGDRMSGYSFNSYQVYTYQHQQYSRDRDVDWEPGTEVVSIWYDWRDSVCEVEISIPIRWLDEDWQSLETARITALKEEDERRAEEAEARAEAARREREYAEYRRLRSKFEGIDEDD